MLRKHLPAEIARSQLGPLVPEADIDALVAQGWDYLAAYRHLQAVAHQAAFRAELERQSDV